jgi:hypothetical protein
MFPNEKVFEAVGRYGGTVAVVVLVLAVVILGLSQIPGTPEQKNKRFPYLAGMLFVFGLLALGSLYIPAVRRASPNSVTTTTMTTNGQLSPIAPGNSGTITINGQGTDASKKGSK